MQHISKYNLKVRTQRTIPIIFHNLQNYDAHLFIRELAKYGEIVNCIPLNKEKYISFTKYVKVDETPEKDKNGKTIINEDGSEKMTSINMQARFIDSYKFFC